MKNKTIGYLTPQYFDCYLKGGSGQQEEPPELTDVFDKYREKAKDTYYYLGPGRLSCTGSCESFCRSFAMI